MVDYFGGKQVVFSIIAAIQILDVYCLGRIKKHRNPILCLNLTHFGLMAQRRCRHLAWAGGSPVPSGAGGFQLGSISVSLLRRLLDFMR